MNRDIDGAFISVCVRVPYALACARAHALNCCCCCSLPTPINNRSSVVGGRVYDTHSHIHTRSTNKQADKQRKHRALLFPLSFVLLPHIEICRLSCFLVGLFLLAFYFYTSMRALLLLVLSVASCYTFVLFNFLSTAKVKQRFIHCFNARVYVSIYLHTHIQTHKHIFVGAGPTFGAFWVRHSPQAYALLFLQLLLTERVQRIVCMCVCKSVFLFSFTQFTISTLIHRLKSYLSYVVCLS